MYKCKECGLEYKFKPDYCECGNDEFAEENPTYKTKPEKKVELNSIKITETKNFEPQSQIQTKAFAEQYPAISKFVQSVDPISGIIFCLCIIFSFIVIFFLWNPKEQLITETQPQIVTNKNIPPIEKFWNNSTEGMVQTELKKEEPKIIEQVVNNIIPKQQKNITVKAITPKVQVKTQSVSSKTPVKQPASKPANTKTYNPKSQTTATQTDKTATTSSQTVTRDPALVAAEEAKKRIEAKQEFENYKSSLRNTIGRKVDFTKVIGDGECSVSFKIDASGKLINRSFAKQSNNITLNDAVYSAIMSTPSFNPPPSAYNNEFFSLCIKFYNGNFEISLR